MAEIDMNDYDTFDENIGSLKDNLSSKEKIEYYLSRLTTRISGEASIGKIRNEVYNFIYVNTLMDADIKKHLIELADGNYTDGLKLSNDILNYLKQAYSNVEYVFEKEDKKMDEVKEDFVERMDDKLDVSNIEVEGRYQELKNVLNTEEDLNKLNNEINLASAVSNDENNRVYLTISDLKEAVVSPNEGVLKDKVVSQIENKTPPVITDEKILEMNGNIQDTDNKNYMAMMLMGLTNSDMNLDMYLSKSQKNSTNYKATFGRLPIKNHPENGLTDSEISRINQIVNGYQTTNNYQEMLSNTNPTLGTLNDIMFDEISAEGTMKVGINNHNGNYDIGLNLSSEHQNLTDAFNTNGASVSMDNNENSVIKVNGDKMTQFSILSNTKATLVNDKEKSMVNNYQYVKKMETPNNEAAKVSPYFLIVVGIAEVLLVGFYFIFLFK